MSKINSFKCPRCNKFTRHIEISDREMMALHTKDGYSEFSKFAVGLLSGAADYIGLTKFSSIVGGENYWKCVECGLGTRRLLSGEITATSEEIEGYDTV